MAIKMEVLGDLIEFRKEDDTVLHLFRLTALSGISRGINNDAVLHINGQDFSVPYEVEYVNLSSTTNTFENFYSTFSLDIIPNGPSTVPKGGGESGGSAGQAKTLAADLVLPFNGATPAAVPDLTGFTVAAGKVYKLTIHGTCTQNNSTTGGFKMFWVRSGGADGTFGGMTFGQENSGNTSIRNHLVQNQLTGPETSGTSAVAPVKFGLYGHMYFICTVSGTLDIHFGGEVSSLSVTLYAGSCGFVEEFTTA